MLCTPSLCLQMSSTANSKTHDNMGSKHVSGDTMFVFLYQHVSPLRSWDVILLVVYRHVSLSTTYQAVEIDWELHGVALINTMDTLSKTQKDEFATAFAILALYDGGVSRYIDCRHCGMTIWCKHWPRHAQFVVKKLCCVCVNGSS